MTEQPTQPFFILEDLDYIFIRATNNDGDWGSFSLNEISDQQFVDWAKSKGLKDIQDADDIKGTPWTKQQKVDLLNHLHDHGVIITMIKREQRRAYNKMQNPKEG